MDLKQNVPGSNFTRVCSLPRKIDFDMLQGRKALCVIIIMENTYNYEEQIQVVSAFKKLSHVGLSTFPSIVVIADFEISTAGKLVQLQCISVVSEDHRSSL